MNSADALSPVPVDPQRLGAVAAGVAYDPHAVLGPHLGAGSVTIRAVRPLADSVVVVAPDRVAPARHEQDGVWVAVLPGAEVPDYRLDVTYAGVTTRQDDPYRFLPTVGELDRHLIREGRHERLWTVLGATVHSYPSVLGEVHGTAFAVWAPNARAVRVVGDFNSWQGASHAMRSLGDSGVWEIFVPGVGPGTRYKFEVLGQDGSLRQKADPLAKATEVPPATASPSRAGRPSGGGSRPGRGPRTCTGCPGRPRGRRSPHPGVAQEAHGMRGALPAVEVADHPDSGARVGRPHGPCTSTSTLG